MLGRPALVAFTLCSALVSRAAAPQTRPNVILLMADDMGWGDLGPGATTLTPHLDAMSANGLTFHRFYAAAPVCSPTRYSIMTGRTECVEGTSRKPLQVCHESPICSVYYPCPTTFPPCPPPIY